MSDIKTTLNKLWNGNVPLWQTFWLYYFIAVAVLNFIARAMGGEISTIFSLASLLWTGFMVLPIWRSADKYTGNSLFGLAAKIAAIVIAIGVVTTLL